MLPGYRPHATQPGNRRQQTFFDDSDYALYRDLLADAARRAGAEIWAYCLMPNHVHVIAVPSDEDGLCRTFADAHRRYTGFINARHRCTGHLWQRRFGAVVMDEEHLAHAMRYVALNPVRARLVEQAGDWAWSSVRAHLAGKDDALVTVQAALARYSDFAAFLGTPVDYTGAWQMLRREETTDRPIGARDWIEQIEQRTGRILVSQKRGPKTRVLCI